MGVGVSMGYYNIINLYLINITLFVYTLSLLQYHETIKEALDAVRDGGVIIVHSGVYDEQLSISKPVAIIGAGTVVLSAKTLHVSWFIWMKN